MPVAPELEQRQPHRGRAAQDRADIGDEADQPRHQPHDQPELQPRQHQRGRIERAQDQADRPLPADERRQGRVDLARDAADDRGMVARQQVVDQAHHPVPVHQEVEGDDRHQHHQQHHVDQPGDRGQHRLQELPAALADRLDQPGQRLAQLAVGIHQVRELRHKERLYLLDDLRRGGHQSGGLPDQRGHDQKRHHDEDQDRAHRDDDGRQRAPQPQTLQPVGDRIEHVGDRPADHEGQEHVAQNPQISRNRTAARPQ